MHKGCKNMKTLITINGTSGEYEQSEKSLESALAQSCDICLITNKKIPVSSNIKILVTENEFVKSSIRFANNYNFVYLMEPNTVLLDNCIKKLTQIEEIYSYAYSDYYIYYNRDNATCSQINFLQSLIDKKIDTGPNKLIRISKNLPNKLDEILYSGMFSAKHIPEPTYFIEN